MHIGDVARVTGISVRTLHHYEALGLVRPTRRDARRHRVYDERALARLQHVLSLRALGLSLAEIRAVIVGRTASPTDIVEGHIEQLRRDIDRRERLLRRLETIAAHLRRGESPAAEHLLRAIEETTMMTMLETAFTPEQLERMATRHQRLSVAEAREEAEAWRSAITDARAAHARGVSPNDPQLAPLAKRWGQLVEDLGDAELRVSLASLYAAGGAAQYGLEGGVDRFVGALLRVKD